MTIFYCLGKQAHKERTQLCNFASYNQHSPSHLLKDEKGFVLGEKQNQKKVHLMARLSIMYFLLLILFFALYSPNTAYARKASSSHLLRLWSAVNCIHSNTGYYQNGDTLYSGDCLYSFNYAHVLIQQLDGNLVVYDIYGSTAYATWASGTNVGNDFATIQGDGNLVVYSGASLVQCATGTNGNPHAWLTMQNDGNLVIYTYNGSYQNDRAIWGTQNGGRCNH